jgi:hypothetical protein
LAGTNQKITKLHKSNSADKFADKNYVKDSMKLSEYMHVAKKNVYHERLQMLRRTENKAKLVCASSELRMQVLAIAKKDN